MNTVLFAIYIPLILGLAAVFLPKKLFKVGGIFAVLSSLCLIAGSLGALPSFGDEISIFSGGPFALILTALAGLFSLLVALYSIGSLGKDYPVFYWSLFCWMMASAAGVFLSARVIPLLVSWGISGVILSLLIWQSGQKDIGKKTLIIVGGSDAFMMLGLVGLWVISGTDILSMLSTDLSGFFRWVIFLSLLCASFAKAGAMPFHTWIPDTARDAPAPVFAILPASIDKLLGIFLLKRVVSEWFSLSPGGNTVLLAAGSFTIVAAVFMALSQHNLKRLLGYHAVSQVGYMLIGLGTASAVGIAGGLLHMLNNSIYKQGLFLSSAIVHKRTGTARLDKLGGLFKSFPITFVSFTLMAMAISGLPPLNGFISKWLVYHGIVSSGNSSLWVLWFAAALFGSVLTLASFFKITHAVFLGQSSKSTTFVKEKLGWEMPAIIIFPLMCIAIGIFPQYTAYPFLESALGSFTPPLLWQPSVAAGLLFVGVLFVMAVYALSGVKRMRRSKTYIGGEKLTPAMRVSGVQFYSDIENMKFFKKMYGWARKNFFDIYEILKALVFYCIRVLRRAHSGVLSVYLLWMLAGSVVVFYLLLLK
ncbi:MAG: complex I subunit 5 family protein [Elusimicrobiota bacterium]